MKVFATGAAGYIGSILVPNLLNQGHHVTVLDNFMYGQTPFNQLCGNLNFDVIKGDARDRRVVLPLLYKADVFLPLAALVGAPLCEADPIGAETTNVDAIAWSVGSLTDNQAVIAPISNSGYGVGEPGKECTESSPLNPISLYGRTKVAAEKLVLGHKRSISLRLATVFGMSPRMRTDLLVNDFIRRAVDDRAVVLFEAHFKRNYIHIKDVARAFSFAITRLNTMSGPYNVGLSDANLSKLELCKRIQKHIPGFVFWEAPIGEDPDKRDYVVSNAKIEAAGFYPHITLDSGIKELMVGYRMMKHNQYGNW